MKIIRISVSVVLVLSLSNCAQNIAQQTYTSDQPVSVQVFYTELGPYGRWIDYAPYGYVWIPDVPPGFSPYLTEGHWVYTRFGWTWYSHYNWGWAPFHYGRWHYDIAYGWMWLPDTVWGPAWVAWRRGGGYCGWAPLGFNVSVHVVIDGGHHIPHERWIFVHDEDLSRHDVNRHRVDHARNYEMVEKAPITRQVREERSVVYMPGPDKDQIQRTTKRPINEVEIRERVSPGATRLKRDRLEVYKPPVRREIPNERTPAPEKVYKPDEVKPPVERKIRDRSDINRQPRISEPQRQPAKRETRTRDVEKDNSGKTKTKKTPNSRDRSTRGSGG